MRVWFWFWGGGGSPWPGECATALEHLGVPMGSADVGEPVGLEFPKLSRQWQPWKAIGNGAASSRPSAQSWPLVGECLSVWIGAARKADVPLRSSLPLSHLWLVFVPPFQDPFFFPRFALSPGSPALPSLGSAALTDLPIGPPSCFCSATQTHADVVSVPVLGKASKSWASLSERQPAGRRLRGRVVDHGNQPAGYPLRSLDDRASTGERLG